MKAKNVFKYIGIGILGTAFLFLVIFGVQALWNWLIPDLFGGPELGYWQTAGLFLLSKILLTGVAPGQHSDHRKSTWKKKFNEKWDHSVKESPDIVS
ncbi:MAG TPA: hypothetical protein PK719_03645 [Bacteroidales bacterium]|jgi:hypothetical protein|nr:hypothetical protein [Bacteroidales bacterium]OQB60511.1 MAG: hypothetical protein BWX96_02159 [Bacteroidetes bacterium ADurb.Bin145]NMD02052.1 hypothetical protein [Bacteroidales bacterium]HOU03199.1 hypothetical protein [Bacteroidales bacterium]HQG62726.1 hypothetical protein [Bacteroidales bacterium]